MTNQMNDNKQDNKVKIIEIAMSFPMDDLLRKYCMEHSLPIETAREHEQEIKRFLALSGFHLGMTMLTTAANMDKQSGCLPLKIDTQWRCLYYSMNT